jgi:CRP-like cAMP-binding protein
MMTATDQEKAWLAEFFSTSSLPERRLRQLRKGERLFRKGDKADHVIVVLNGYVKLVFAGNTQEVLPPNRWLFEHAHVSHVYLQSAFALTDCTVIAFEPEYLAAMRREHPALERKFLADMADRMAEKNQSLEPANRRLARRLLQMSNGKDKVIEAGPQQLGDLIGASRQMVDQIMRRFDRAGLVKKLRRGGYHVNKAALERFLEPGEDA